MEPQNNYQPNLNQQNVPLISSVAESAPQKPRWFLWLILLVIGALVITSIVYKLTTYQFATDNPPNFLKQQNTNNWKTYRNDQYQFSLQYPLDWNLSIDLFQEKGEPKAVSTFQLTRQGCEVALVRSGGKSLEDGWILRDESFLIGGKTFQSRLFYYGDKNHLRWISVYNFPQIGIDLTLRADDRQINDITSDCLVDFNRIVSSIDFLGKSINDTYDHKTTELIIFNTMFGAAPSSSPLSVRWKLYDGHYELEGYYSIYAPGFDYGGNLIFEVKPGSYSALPITPTESYTKYFNILNDLQLNEVMGIDKSILGKSVICGFEGEAKIIIDQYYYLSPTVAGKGGDANYAHVFELKSFSPPKEIPCH